VAMSTIPRASREKPLTIQSQNNAVEVGPSGAGEAGSPAPTPAEVPGGLPPEPSVVVVPQQTANIEAMRARARACIEAAKRAPAAVLATAAAAAAAEPKPGPGLEPGLGLGPGSAVLEPELEPELEPMEPEPAEEPGAGNTFPRSAAECLRQQPLASLGTSSAAHHVDRQKMAAMSTKRPHPSPTEPEPEIRLVEWQPRPRRQNEDNSAHPIEDMILEQSLVSLEEATKHLPVARVDVYAMRALRFVREEFRPKNPHESRSDDQLAAVWLYTAEFKLEQCDGCQDGKCNILPLSSSGKKAKCKRVDSIYSVMNRTIGATPADKDAIAPWMPYLYLLLSALAYEPSYTGTVLRGVQFNRPDLTCLDDLDPEMRFKGHEFIWWRFTSCTQQGEALQDPFLDQSGARVLFNIRCHSGVRIPHLSAESDEAEVLLPPGMQFCVTQVAEPAPGLFTISLEEVHPGLMPVVSRAIGRPYYMASIDRALGAIRIAAAACLLNVIVLVVPSKVMRPLLVLNLLVWLRAAGKGFGMPIRSIPWFMCRCRLCARMTRMADWCISEDRFDLLISERYGIERYIVPFELVSLAVAIFLGSVADLINIYRAEEMAAHMYAYSDFLFGTALAKLIYFLCSWLICMVPEVDDEGRSINQICGGKSVGEMSRLPPLPFARRATAAALQLLIDGADLSAYTKECLTTAVLRDIGVLSVDGFQWVPVKGYDNHWEPQKMGTGSPKNHWDPQKLLDVGITSENEIITVYDLFFDSATITRRSRAKQQMKWAQIATELAPAELAHWKRKQQVGLVCVIFGGIMQLMTVWITYGDTDLGSIQQRLAMKIFEAGGSYSMLMFGASFVKLCGLVCASSWYWVSEATCGGWLRCCPCRILSVDCTTLSVLNSLDTISTRRQTSKRHNCLRCMGEACGYGFFVGYCCWLVLFYFVDVLVSAAFIDNQWRCPGLNVWAAQQGNCTTDVLSTAAVCEGFAVVGLSTNQVPTLKSQTGTRMFVADNIPSGRHGNGFYTRTAHVCHDKYVYMGDKKSYLFYHRNFSNSSSWWIGTGDSAISCDPSNSYLKSGAGCALSPDGVGCKSKWQENLIDCDDTWCTNDNVRIIASWGPGCDADTCAPISTCIARNEDHICTLHYGEGRFNCFLDGGSLVVYVLSACWILAYAFSILNLGCSWFWACSWISTFDSQPLNQQHHDENENKKSKRDSRIVRVSTGSPPVCELDEALLSSGRRSRATSAPEYPSMHYEPEEPEPEQ
jgi:hypothetical protein